VWKICANPAVEAAARAFHIDYSTRFDEHDPGGG